MILEKTPITMAEVKEILKNEEEKQVLKDYLKKFTKLNKDKAESLIKEIHSLNNVKIKEEDVIKLSDFLPKTSEEINKIFTQVSLTEDEVNKILDVVKKY